MANNNNLDDFNTIPVDLELKNSIENSISDLNETKEPGLSRRAIRSLAFHFLYAVDRFDYSVPLGQVVDNFKVGFEIDIDENSPAILMAKEVIENREELDEKIKPLLKNWKLERLGCCTRLILRMALCELDQPDAIASVIINEAVELAKSFAEKDAYKFVNGILDEICKQKGLIVKQEEASNDTESK